MGTETVHDCTLRELAMSCSRVYNNGGGVQILDHPAWSPMLLQGASVLLQGASVLS